MRNLNVASMSKEVAINGDNINDDGSGAKYLRIEPPMISVVSLVLAEPTKNDPVGPQHHQCVISIDWINQNKH